VKEGEKVSKLISGCAVSACALALLAGSAAGAAAKTLYVARGGKDSNPCTAKKPCRTIAHAVQKAGKGYTVLVGKGTYDEMVVITKDVHVIGTGGPTVSAKGRVNGFLIKGSSADGASVSGFVVKGANFEGILAMQTSRVTISHNIVTGNDQGLKANKPTGECAPVGEIPGDCGEGLHLMSVTHSKVLDNSVYRNAGGILLTDELGPTAHNMIAGNRVLNNVLDCGITLAGHNPGAVKAGKPQPSAGGVYDNLIIGNTANGNGTKGEGAGILMAGGAPGTAVYGNLVKGNIANGNGLAGVTIHSHAPGQDLNGNRIIANRLNHDGVADAPSEAEFGENNGKTSVTVGILVGSNVTKLSGIVIKGNTISHTHYGIFTKNVPPIAKKANTFQHVAVPLKQI
jgi:nitrous oxidase accessory protein NosD